MIFNQKEVVLKNGKKCVLKSAEIEDAAKMIEFLKIISSETDFLLLTPEEVFDVEHEKEYIKAINDSKNRLMITAFIDDEIAGNCQISFNIQQKIKHRCSIAIAIKSKFWNLGLGTALISELINQAKINNCVQMELEFIEENTRAQALYQKMGFYIIAERKKSIKLKDGTYRNEFLMIKDLE